MSEPPAWSTTDYLLQGRFCPLPTIRRRLDALARSLDAEAVLLLVADHTAVLRTLCMFAGSADATAVTTALQASIGGGARPQASIVGRAKLQDLVRVDRRPDGSSSHRFPRSLPVIIRWLGVSVALPPSAERDWFGNAGAWVAVQPVAHQRGARIATAVLALGPRGTTLDQMGVPVVGDDDACTELAEMVSCTVQADVRRDAITSSLVDAAVDWRGITLDRAGFTTAAQQFVGLAVEVANCQVGALYLRDGPGGDLVLAAVRGAGDKLGMQVPKRIVASATTALQCMDRRRAVQYPSNPAEGPVGPTFAAAAERMAEWAELATPVLGPSANMGLPAAGVLIVARSGSHGRDSASFGAYDHAVLRNVALRLTLLRSATNMEEVARSYSELAQESPRDGEDVWRPSASGEGRAGPRPLPADLRMAMPRIREAIASVVAATNCQSGTFRAALPEADDEEVGVALVRVAAHPPERYDDAMPVQTRRVGGRNWRAALSGKRADARHVEHDQHGDHRVFREGTASAVTVPVRVEDRVVGVINLESRDEDAFATHTGAIDLLATQVGRAIAETRLLLSRDLQALAIQIVTSGHDFAGDAKEMRRIAEEMRGHSVATRLRRLRHKVDRHVRTLRTIATEPPPAPGTFPDLVLRALADGPEMGPVEIAELAWPTYHDEEARSLSEALRHVVANVKEHADTEPGPRPQALVTATIWGGHDHDVLHLTHRVHATKMPDTQRALDVYRVPLADGAARDGAGRGRVRPRFGAYLAGMQARRLGGDVWLTPLDPERVRVTLAVPRAGRSGGAL